VLLPTPDDPTRATVVPGPRCAAGSRGPPGDGARGDDRHAGRDLLELGLGDGHLDRVPGKVHLRQEDDGRAPDSHAVARYRSIRRGLRSRLSDVATRTTSTFAARTWTGAP